MKYSPRLSEIIGGRGDSKTSNLFTICKFGSSAVADSRNACGCESYVDPNLADPDYPQPQNFWIRTPLTGGGAGGGKDTPELLCYSWSLLIVAGVEEFSSDFMTQ